MQIFGVFIGFLSLALFAMACDVPPTLWCENESLAQKCGVSSQCQAYKTATQNQKIKITLLYESFCPGCQDFILTKLWPKIYKTPINELVDYELIPFGNAHVLANGSIVCQHGEKECEGDRLESCAIHFAKEKQVSFVQCFENQLNTGEVDIHKAAKYCYKELELTPGHVDAITHCFHGNLGIKLQEDAAKRTKAIGPDKHSFVPWVMVNEVSLANVQDPLQSMLPQLICLWYNGDKKQQACSQQRRISLLTNRPVHRPIRNMMKLFKSRRVN